MKDYQLQTPKKDYPHANRRSKSISEHTKKPQKINKKCLNSVFTSVSEDASFESPKDLIEFSSISEISEDNQLGESAEFQSFILGESSEFQSFIASPNPVISSSSETVALSDLASFSSTVTADKDEVGDVSVSHCRSSGSKTGVDIVSVEAEMVVNHLKQARIQVMNSTNADLQSKKLLEALIELVIEEFNILPEERDRFAELVSTKTRVMFLSLLLWILAVLVVVFFCFGARSSFSEPPPT